MSTAISALLKLQSRSPLHAKKSSCVKVQVNQDRRSFFTTITTTTTTKCLSLRDFGLANFVVSEIILDGQNTQKVKADLTKGSIKSLSTGMEYKIDPRQFFISRVVS